MRNWTDPPPDIATILRRYKDLGLTGAINIFFPGPGDGDRGVQVSVQSGRKNAYSCAQNDDPLIALLEALGPPPGGSWADLLKLDMSAPAPKPVRHKTTAPAPPPVEEDEDDFSVI